MRNSRAAFLPKIHKKRNTALGFPRDLICIHTMMSSAQKMAKIMDGKSSAVAIVQRFHILPLKNLYMVADQYPAKPPISTNSTSRAVNMPPLIGQSPKPRAPFVGRSIEGQSNAGRSVGRSVVHASHLISSHRSHVLAIASFCFCCPSAT